MMGEVGVNRWNYSDEVRGHTTDATQEIDGTLKTSTEETRPVKNRLPTLAEVKSNVEVGGRALFKISRFKRLKNARINSFFAGVIDFHISDVPSTIDCHSSCAAIALELSR